jgi:katanin p60 ATPase-containing subunit A1
MGASLICEFFWLLGDFGTEGHDGNSQFNYKEDHVPKPMSSFTSHYTGEMKDLAETISNDVYVKNPEVFWDHIIGMEPAKKVLKEAVVYPIKYPMLFRGILSPWKGLLLFGYVGRYRSGVFESV